MKMSFRLRAAIVSVALLFALLGAWHIATSGTGQHAASLVAASSPAQVR